MLIYKPIHIFVHIKYSVFCFYSCWYYMCCSLPEVSLRSVVMMTINLTMECLCCFLVTQHQQKSYKREHSNIKYNRKRMETMSFFTRPCWRLFSHNSALMYDIDHLKVLKCRHLVVIVCYYITWCCVFLYTPCEMSYSCCREHRRINGSQI